MKPGKDKVTLPCLGGPFCGERVTQAPATASEFYVERREFGGRRFWSAYHRRQVGLKLWRWAIAGPDGKKLYYVGHGKPTDTRIDGHPAKVTLDKVVERHEMWVWEQEECDVPDGADAERGGAGDAG